MANLPSAHKYESTVRGKNLAQSFWDFVKQDPQGNTFAPGYSGDTYQLNNVWNYVKIGKSAFASGTTVNPGTTTEFIISPGKVDISISKQFLVDIVKPVTKNEGIIKPQGIPPARFDMKFLIWTAQQWGAFQDFARLYVPTPRLPPKAYVCFHPALQLHKIGAAVITGLDGPYDGPVARSKVFIFKCVEFAPVSEETEVPFETPYIYSPYDKDSTTSSLSSTPGNTESPEQPQGLQE